VLLISIFYFQTQKTSEQYLIRQRYLACLSKKLTTGLLHVRSVIFLSAGHTAPQSFYRLSLPLSQALLIGAYAYQS